MYSGVVTAYCSCSTTNPAEYIPTWPSLSWVSELINKKDSSCVKLVRSKLSQFSAIIVSSAIMCENLTVYFRVCLDAAREHSWILRKQRGLKSQDKNKSIASSAGSQFTLNRHFLDLVVQAPPPLPKLPQIRKAGQQVVELKKGKIINLKKKCTNPPLLGSPWQHKIRAACSNLEGSCLLGRPVSDPKEQAYRKINT